MTSQSPLADSGKATEWKQVCFDPTGKPHLFVASTRSIRILDLVQQKELRNLRLDGSGDFVSSMALHPSGEHFIVIEFNRKGQLKKFNVTIINFMFLTFSLK